MQRSNPALAFFAGMLAVIAPKQAASADNQSVIVSSSETSPPTSGPEAYFTGSVRITTPVKTAAPARVSGATVAFEPGARTAWHTHPLGQSLIVTEGRGWVQQEGQPAQAIKTGDVVWIPPGVKHWHGATAATALTHVAIGEQLDGKSVTWLEKVTDAEYPR